MAEVITVIPDGSGWAVSNSSSWVRHRFASGRTAEAFARQLGSALAAVGDGAEVQIYLRDGSLAGKAVFAPTSAREPA